MLVDLKLFPAIPLSDLSSGGRVRIDIDLSGNDRKDKP